MLSLEESVEEYALTLVAALSVGHLFTGPIPNIFKPPGGETYFKYTNAICIAVVGTLEYC